MNAQKTQKTQKAIRNELKKLGITKSVAANSSYDGTPTVLLRWNGKEEHVSTTHFALGENDLPTADDDKYIAWLTKTYADENLQG